MLLGFTHFFEDKVKNDENFRTYTNFDLGTPCIGNSREQMALIEIAAP